MIIGANYIAASVIKLLDESKSAWPPCKDKTGGLPNIFFILQKPEPLGTEFESMAYWYLISCVFYFILFPFVLINIFIILYFYNSRDNALF
jgi:hypothetical protein